MSLEYAILGFLTYKPFSGYELKKVFDNSIRHFWYADQSQIYRTLNRLLEKGWAEMDVVEQNDRPDRKEYRITQVGRDELSQWLKGSFPTQEAHSAPLIQVFFSGLLSNQEILKKLEDGAAFFRQILERYQNVPAQVEDYVRMVNSPRETFFWMSTLDLGIQLMETQLAWIENLIDMLQKGEVPD